MKTVILAGGRGTRMENETQYIPKPMVPVGDKPIIWHIMKIFDHYGFKEFLILTGYRGKEFIKLFDLIDPSWDISLIDTGLETLTATRLNMVKDLLKDDFFMTYGDGLADINLFELIRNHTHNSTFVTVTAVHPPGRFGAMELQEDGKVTRFVEKEPLRTAWINGGFFIIKPRAFDYITGEVMWEHRPLQNLAHDGQLNAYKHEGFWQCMDTPRDLIYLNELWAQPNCPWRVWA